MRSYLVDEWRVRRQLERLGAVRLQPEGLTGRRPLQRFNDDRLRAASVIVRDRRRVFIDSQSLRKLELDDRREVGIIIRDRQAVRRGERVFTEDWKQGMQSDKNS